MRVHPSEALKKSSLTVTRALARGAEFHVDTSGLLYIKEPKPSEFLVIVNEQTPQPLPTDTETAINLLSQLFEFPERVRSIRVASNKPVNQVVCKDMKDKELFLSKVAALYRMSFKL